MVASDTLITVCMMSWPLIKIKFELKYVTVEKRVDFDVLGYDSWQVFDEKVGSWTRNCSNILLCNRLFYQRLLSGYFSGLHRLVNCNNS